VAEIFASVMDKGMGVDSSLPLNRLNYYPRKGFGLTITNACIHELEAYCLNSLLMQLKTLVAYRCGTVTREMLKKS